MAMPADDTASENNFVVRVYRRDERNPLTLIGVVEETGGGANHVKVFRTAEDLMGILLGRKHAFCCSTGQAAEIPITVKGRDVDGRHFTENSTLTGLTPGGAVMTIKSAVAPGSSVIIHVAPVRSGPGIKAVVVDVKKPLNGALKRLCVSFDMSKGAPPSMV